MNFRMRAAPVTETAIGHTSHSTNQVTGSKHGCRSNSTDPRRRTSRDASELRRTRATEHPRRRYGAERRRLQPLKPTKPWLAAQLGLGEIGELVTVPY